MFQRTRKPAFAIAFVIGSFFSDFILNFCFNFDILLSNTQTTFVLHNLT